MGTQEIEYHQLLEHVRATLRYAVFTCGHTLAEIALHTGVSRTTLTRLLKGGGLAFPAYGRVLAWCDMYGIVRAHPEQAALSLLVSSYPLQLRQRTRESLVRWTKNKLLKTGHRLPQWLEDELRAGKMVRPRRRIMPAWR